MTAARNQPMADPGTYVPDAAQGTVAHAQTMRISFRNAVAALPEAPSRVKRYWDYFLANKTWELLNRRDGSTFATFESFCEYEEPWGLGTAYPKLKGHVAAILADPHDKDAGQRKLSLDTVPAAKSPPGVAAEVNRAECGLLGEADRKTQALRAIRSRAPEQVRDLYRDGLLGQKEAAKLGPKNPTPEEAAKVTEVAIVLAEKARTASKPTTEQERRRLKQTITAEARKMLGQETEDQVSRLLKTIKKLSADDLGKLFEGLRLAYGAEFEGPK